MCLDEQTGNSDRKPRASQRGSLRSAAVSDVRPSARPLQCMSHVEDYRSHASHFVDAKHVDDEIVVAEATSLLAQQDLVATGFAATQTWFLSQAAAAASQPRWISGLARPVEPCGFAKGFPGKRLDPNRAGMMTAKRGTAELAISTGSLILAIDCVCDANRREGRRGNQIHELLYVG